MLFGDTAGGIKVKAFAPVHETTCIQAYTSVYACIQAFERGAKKTTCMQAFERGAENTCIQAFERGVGNTCIQAFARNARKHLYTSVCTRVYVPPIFPGHHVAR